MALAATALVTSGARAAPGEVVAMLYFDPVYFIFALPALALVMYAQVGSLARATGEQVGRRLLDQAGLGFVNIERIPGELTDHYDPKAKVLRLSDGVYGNTSVAALGIVAHECGHA